MLAMAEQVRGRPLPRLKAWRIQKLMTQADLAAAAGVGKATVYHSYGGPRVLLVP